MKTFLRLLQLSRPYHHYVPEYIIYIFLYTIFSLFSFTLVMPLMDALFSTGQHTVVTQMPDFSLSVNYFKDLFYYYLNYYVNTTGKFGVLVYVCLVILVAVLLKNLFGFLSQKVLTRMRVNMVRKMREKLYLQFSSQSLRFYHNERKGDLLSTVSGDVVEVENSVVTSLQTVFRDPLQVIATFVTLFILSRQLTLFTLLVFPLSGYLISTITGRLKKKAVVGQNLLGKILNITEETLSGIRIIKAFNAEGFMRRKFEKENNEFANTVRAMQNQRELASPLSETMGVLVIIVIMIYAGNLILTGATTLKASAFIAYIALYFQIIAPAKNIANAFSVMPRGLAAGERVLRVLDIANTIEDKPNAQAIHSFEKEIRYQDVAFRYDEQHYVLKDINLTIEKGKMVALVGKSGAGKSTMADLLPRFYDVTDGSIQIDGQDIRDLKMHDVRGLMGMVSQEAILFNDSVFSNIAFGQPDADKKAVIRAAKIANAHEFIIQLENGYDTSIGDRGMKLSGGQRQRLTIARAIFKNPPILILDEATSALDTESEKLVQEALDKLMENRTTIVIAHRLSTIQHANEIVVLDKGEIKERGTHDELMAVNGIYRRLVEMQEFK